MESSLQRVLTKAFMPGKRVWITICTVGGTDENGNEVNEPEVFNGYAGEGVKWVESHRDEIESLLYGMPDGYIEVECDQYGTEVYNADDLIEQLESWC